MTTTTMNGGIQYRYDRRKDFTLSLVVGLLAMIIGAFGVWRAVIHGDHGAVGSYVPWGLWVSVYVYLVWMEVGMILGYYALKHVLKVEGIERLGPVIVMAAICALLSSSSPGVVMDAASHPHMMVAAARRRMKFFGNRFISLDYLIHHPGQGLLLLYDFNKLNFKHKHSARQYALG